MDGGNNFGLCPFICGYIMIITNWKHTVYVKNVSGESNMRDGM